MRVVSVAHGGQNGETPDSSDRVAQECLALRGTPGEVETLAFAELAADTIEGWQ